MRQHKEMLLKRSTMAYLTPFIWGDISLNYFKGVIDAMEVADCNLICYVGGRLEDSGNCANQANAAYELMSEKWIDGMVVWASQIGELLNPVYYEQMHKRFIDVPTVTIAGYLQGADAVFSDENQGMALLMDHLVQVHGFKRFAFAAATDTHPIGKKRLEAFVAYLDAHRLPKPIGMMSPEADFSKEAGIKAVDYWLKQFGPEWIQSVDCIIAVSDLVASGVTERLRMRGFMVPEQIHVVGINNNHDALVSTPPLTTVDPQIRQIGQTAARALFHRIEASESKKEPLAPKEYQITPQLIIRRSCGCHDQLEMTTQKIDHLLDQTDLVNLLEQQVEDTLQAADRYMESGFSKAFVTAFISVLKGESTTTFMRMLKEAMFVLKFTNEELGFWHHAIGHLENAIDAMALSLEAENLGRRLLSASRVEVDLAIEHQYAASNNQTSTFLYNLNKMNETLRSTFKINDVMTGLSTILKDFRIPGCYIALYDHSDKGQTAKQATLAFAYRDYEIQDLDSEKPVFPIEQLLPEGYLPTDYRYTAIVHALYFQEIALGYVVFELGPIDKSIYTILCTEISGALHRVNIFTALKESEQAREALLLKLEKDNQLLERKVAERTADIERANEAKSRFLSNMSHEIRTPLNGIIGFADMIRATSKEAEVVKFIQMVIEETEKLLLLINQLLDLSKIEAGKIELSDEVMSIQDMMASLASIYSVGAHKKGLSFRYTVDSKIDSSFKTDALRLRQILVNLIGNAVKFTEEGYVEVLVKQVSVNEKKALVLFEIIDTGIGIEAHRLEAIFDVFVQEADSTTKAYGGTGLGTAIAKQLVDLMGGTIGVTSKKGKGSTFWIQMPLIIDKPLDEVCEQQKSIQTHRIEGPIIGYEQAKILVVEDYAPNQILAMAYLKPLNCHVDVADNGQIAIDLLDKTTYDIILMDVQMPILDGVEATKYIRYHLLDQSTIIIGITANAYETDIAYYESIGMQTVVTKPFRKKSLLQAVMTWYDQKETLQMPLDLKPLLQDLDYNRQLLDEILTAFMASAKNYVQSLEAGFLHKDMALVAKSAHTLKGAALNMHAQMMAEAAALLETDAKSLKNPGLLQDDYNRLLEAYEAVTTYLKQVTL